MVRCTCVWNARDETLERILEDFDCPAIAVHARAAARSLTVGETSPAEGQG